MGLRLRCQLSLLTHPRHTHCSLGINPMINFTNTELLQSCIFKEKAEIQSSCIFILLAASPFRCVLNRSSCVSHQILDLSSSKVLILGSTDMHRLPLKRFIHVWLHTVHGTSCHRAPLLCPPSFSPSTPEDPGL